MKRSSDGSERQGAWPRATPTKRGLVVVEGRCSEEVRPRSVGVIVSASISFWLVVVGVAVAQHTGIGLATEVSPPGKELRDWTVALAAVLGPTLAFIAAILAASINAGRNREQAKLQAELDRQAAEHRAALDRETAEQLRNEEASALAHALLGEVTACVSRASTLAKLVNEVTRTNDWLL